MHSERAQAAAGAVSGQCADAPLAGMRLLKLDAFLARARRGLPCLYEVLSAVPLAERAETFVQAALYAPAGADGAGEVTPIRALLVSWRWPWAKPRGPDMSAGGPAAAAGALLLVPPQMLEQLAATCATPEYKGIKYVWWDWATVPQYGADVAATMTEIQNSAVYYREAARMFLWSASAADRLMVTPDYHSRVWTLCERIQRGRGAGLYVRDFLTGSALSDLAAATADASAAASSSNGRHAEPQMADDPQHRPQAEPEPEDAPLARTDSASELRLTLSSGVAASLAEASVPRTCQKIFFHWRDLVMLLLGEFPHKNGVVTARNVGPAVVRSMAYVADSLDHLEFLLAAQFDDALCDSKLRGMSPRIRTQYSEDQQESISQFRRKQADLFWMECLRDYPYEAFGVPRPQDSDALEGDAAWVGCIHGLCSLIDGLLKVPLAEAQHDGHWLLRYLASYSIGTYAAWDSKDLLNALVTAQLLAGDTYADIAAAAVRALRAEGIEAALPLLLHHFGEGSTMSARPQPNKIPSYHASHFTPIDFAAPIDHGLSAMQWLADVQELILRWRACGVLCGLAYRVIAFEIGQTEDHRPRVSVCAVGDVPEFYDWNVRRFVAREDEALLEATIDQDMSRWKLPGVPGGALRSCVLNADAPASRPDSTVVVRLMFELHTQADTSWIASDAGGLQVNVELWLGAATWTLRSIDTRLLRGIHTVTPAEQLVPLVVSALAQCVAGGQAKAESRLREAVCESIETESPSVADVHLSRVTVAEPADHTSGHSQSADQGSSEGEPTKWQRVSAGLHELYVPVVEKAVKLCLHGGQQLPASFAFGPECSYAGRIDVMKEFPKTDLEANVAAEANVEQAQQQTPAAGTSLSGLVVVGYRGDPADPGYVPVSEMAKCACTAGAVGLIVVNSKTVPSTLRASGEGSIPVATVAPEIGDLLTAGGVVQLECHSVLPRLDLPDMAVVTDQIENPELAARLLDGLGESQAADQLRREHCIPSVHLSTGDGRRLVSAAFAFGPPMETWSGSAWETMRFESAGHVVALSEDEARGDGVALRGGLAVAHLPYGPQGWHSDTCDLTWRWFGQMAERGAALGAVGLVVVNPDGEVAFLPAEAGAARRGPIPTVSIGASDGAALLGADRSGEAVLAAIEAKLVVCRGRE
jgi:hypothetical protein